MGAAMRELRTAVMILVEASWQEADGTAFAVPARMEDKSASGACIRMKASVAVGTNLSVRWRFEQFSGTCKYCRREGPQYVIGIQRDLLADLQHNLAVPEGTRAISRPDAESLASREPLQPQAKEHQPIATSTAFAGTQNEGRVFRHAASARLKAGIAGESDDREDRPRSSRHEEFARRRRTRLSIKAPPQRKEVRSERRFMGRNWLERAPWNNKHESLGAGADDNGSGSSSGGKESSKSAVPNPRSNTSMAEEEKASSFQVDLLPMEEIYRAAGVVSPQKGYSVHKVVEMLRSEHIRGLSTELKRAAVLMALDAAGVSMEQIQQDAKARQDALDHYEAEQSKQADAEWARRGEENTQIQAELERVKAHYMVRINRNLEGIAREKSTFNDWLALKKQEAESMSEAINLCAKATPISKPAPAPIAVAAAAGAIIKVP
jgi:hypothetical protein